MTEWKEAKLGELGTIVTGKTPSKNNPEDWGDEMLFITPSDYGSYRKWADNSIRKLSTRGVRRLSNKVLPKGSVLVTCIGSDMGKAAMNRKNAITNQQINSIVPNKEVVNPDFTYYLLVALYETLRTYGRDGTAVPILNKGDFEKIDVLIPEKKEQEAIASVLSSLDDKIDLLHRQNKTLEQMAEALFRQWFVVEASEEWENGTLGMLINLDTGYAFKSKFYSNEGDLRVVRGKNVTIGSLRWGTDAKFWNDSIEGLERYLLNKWDIVIGMDGSRIGQNRTLVLETDLPAILAQRVARLKAKKDKQQPFIWKHIISSDFREYITSIHTGTSIPHISQKQIADYEILIPPSSKIDKYSEIIWSFWEKQENNQIQIRTLEKLRDTLLPKLMSGEIRIETHGRASLYSRASQKKL